MNQCVIQTKNLRTECEAYLSPTLLKAIYSVIIPPSLKEVSRNETEDANEAAARSVKKYLYLAIKIKKTAYH